MRTGTLVGLLSVAALCACSGPASTATLPPPPSPAPASSSSGPAPTTTPPAPTTPAPTTALTSSTPTAALPTELGPTYLAPSLLPTDPHLTADQAYALVRRAYDAANLAISTGDTSAYESAVGPSCKCRSLLAFVRRYYDHGQRLRGGLYQGLRAVDFKLARFEATVSTFYTASAGAVLAADGHQLRPVPARSEAQDAVTLQFTAGHWYVADISGLAPGGVLP